MNFIQLEYFCTLAKEEHMSVAASRLFISEPALSSAIKKIEKEMGCKLFDRIGRGIVLNENGRFLYQNAQKILETWSFAIRTLNEKNPTSTNSLSLGVTGIEAPQPIIQSFSLKHPEINIRQSLLHTDEMFSASTQDSPDFIFSTVIPESKSFSYKLILDEPLAAVLPAHHSLAGEKGIHLAELAKERFIVMPEKTLFRALTDCACEAAGFTPNVVLEAYSSQLTDFVAKGNAATIIASFSSPRYAARTDISIIPLLDDFCRYTIYLVWETNRQPFSKLKHEFYNYVLQNGSKLILNLNLNQDNFD